MQNPMHFKTGVVSASIAGVRQFRTRAQTSKNTKQRKYEFAISSGSPPNRSRSASLPGVVFGGSRVSEASSSFQGQRATSEHNLQQKKPAHTPMQSTFGGAIAHKSATALDRQTIKHQLGKPNQQSKHLQTPMHFKTGVVSASIAGVQQFRTKVQTSKHSKNEKASSPFLQGVHLQQVQVRKPSWCCVWWFQGVSDIVSPPKGKGREVNTTCNRSSLHNPPMQSAFGGAIAHKSAKALDRQTTKPASTHLGNQSKRAATSTTKCISKPVW